MLLMHRANNTWALVNNILFKENAWNYAVVEITVQVLYSRPALTTLNYAKNTVRVTSEIESEPKVKRQSHFERVSRS